MDLARNSDGTVNVTFSYEEAFVLFDLLHRWEDQGIDRRADLYEDQAEQRVIWDLSASLEPLLDEALSADYADALSRSRAAVRDATS